MVNLEDWVGQEVLVTYANGETGIYKVEKSEHSRYYYCINNRTYTPGGFYCHGSALNIIKIQPMNKKEQLKQQIKALEAELKNLEVPEGFDEEKAYEFLYEDKNDGLDAVLWAYNTQEGQDYWMEINVKDRVPTDKDIIQLQKWIIESYRRKLGLGS